MKNISSPLSMNEHRGSGSSYNLFFISCHLYSYIVNEDKIKEDAEWRASLTEDEKKARIDSLVADYQQHKQAPA